MQNLDNRKVYPSIFADLSKAFDLIDHDIMIKKLCHYVRPQSANLLQSYLDDRRQYVKIENMESDQGNIDIGVAI